MFVVMIESFNSTRITDICVCSHLEFCFVLVILAVLYLINNDVSFLGGKSTRSSPRFTSILRVNGGVYPPSYN